MNRLTTLLFFILWTVEWFKCEKVCQHMTCITLTLTRHHPFIMGTHQPSQQTHNTQQDGMHESGCRKTRSKRMLRSTRITELQCKCLSKIQDFNWNHTNEMLYLCDGQDATMLDKVVTVCCALVYHCPTVC